MTFTVEEFFASSSVDWTVYDGTAVVDYGTVPVSGGAGTIDVVVYNPDPATWTIEAVGVDGEEASYGFSIVNPAINGPNYYTADQWASGADYSFSGFAVDDDITATIFSFPAYSPVATATAAADGNGAGMVSIVHPAAQDGETYVLLIQGALDAGAVHVGAGTLDPGGPKIIAESDYTAAELAGGITFRYSGMGPGDSLSVNLWGSSGNWIKGYVPTTADSAGAGTATIDWPSALPGGEYRVSISGLVTEFNVFHTFAVDRAAIFALSYASVSQWSGAGVDHRLSGFVPGETIAIDIERNGGAVRSDSLVADVDGVAMISVSLATVAIGDQIRVTATGLTSGASPWHLAGVGPHPGGPASIDAASRYAIGSFQFGTTISFAGFGAGEMVEYWILTEPGGVMVGSGATSARVDGTGAWVVTAPLAAVGQTYLLNAYGSTSGLTATDMFDVLVAPGPITGDLLADYSVSELRAGVPMDIAGLWPNEGVTITVENGTSVVDTFDLTTDASGAVSTTIVDGNAVAGLTYDVVVSSAEYHLMNAFFFDVTDDPAVVVAETEITIPESGDPLLFTYSGFRAGESVDVQISTGGSTAVASAVTASGAGGGSYSPVIGAGPAGTYLAVFTGLTSGRSATTTFTIVGPAAGTDAAGYSAADAATGIGVTFSGFAPGETVEATLSPEPTGTAIDTESVTATADGDGTVTFAIADAAAGDRYRVELTGQTSGASTSVVIAITAGSGGGGSGGTSGGPGIAQHPHTGVDLWLIGSIAAASLPLLGAGIALVKIGRRRGHRIAV